MVENDTPFPHTPANTVERGEGNLILVGLHDAIDLLCLAREAKCSEELAKSVVKAQAAQVELSNKRVEHRLTKLIPAERRSKSCTWNASEITQATS